jgi:hypothetical protein
VSAERYGFVGFSILCAILWNTGKIHSFEVGNAYTSFFSAVSVINFLALALQL